MNITITAIPNMAALSPECHGCSQRLPAQWLDLHHQLLLLVIYPVHDNDLLLIIYVNKCDVAIFRMIYREKTTRPKVIQPSWMLSCFLVSYPIYIIRKCLCVCHTLAYKSIRRMLERVNSPYRMLTLSTTAWYLLWSRFVKWFETFTTVDN